VTCVLVYNRVAILLSIIISSCLLLLEFFFSNLFPCNNIKEIIRIISIRGILRKYFASFDIYIIFCYPAYFLSLCFSNPLSIFYLNDFYYNYSYFRQAS
jgi:hypothetical protein